MMNQIDWVKADNGDVCVITNEGHIVLEPQVTVDRLYHPSFDMCQVEKDGKYGYIDMNGKLVIPFQYDEAYPFSENGLAFVVTENGLGGYIDKTGKFIIKPQYDTGSMFKFGFAAVSKNGDYEYIYQNGMKAVNNTFKYAGGFSDCGLAKVVEFNGSESLMDTTSRVVLTLKKGNELVEFEEGSRVTKFRADDGREALINAAGKIFTGFFEKVIISPYAHLHPFLRNGLWGYVDNEGNEVIRPIYQEVSQFTADKVARVKAFHPLAENQAWEFYIDEQDEIVDSDVIERKKRRLSRRLSYVTPFKKALALAKKKAVDESKTPSAETFTLQAEAFVGELLQLGLVDEDKVDDLATELNDESENTDDENDEFDYYRFYQVEIYFYNKDEIGIIEFIRDELGWDDEIIGIGQNYVTLHWAIENWESPEDIENAMYYVLRDYESVATYEYHLI